MHTIERAAPFPFHKKALLSLPFVPHITPTTNTTPPQVLFWDRVYLVLALTSYGHMDFIDLNAWFHACFAPCMATLLQPVKAQVSPYID